ncbi:nudix hydrolase 17, mitochondrial-like isoform X2 [Nicotiana sylvestris]|uniref:nudix hydrolase 17, mitochondrial-like isoform X2 n=1 Tax=Nicotiana sylvestris TaxID=4096 RepID=UPI00388C667E
MEALCSKAGGIAYEEHMFPLFVVEQLDSWPEKEMRKRTYLDECSPSKKAVPKWMDENSLGTIHRFDISKGTLKASLSPEVQCKTCRALRLA